MGEEWFERWWTYYEVDPWGPKRDDWRVRNLAICLNTPGDPQNIRYPVGFPEEDDSVARSIAVLTAAGEAAVRGE